MDTTTASYKNFQLAHQLKRRIRVIAPILKNDQERCYILEILLTKRLEIKRVRSRSALGSVVIEFNPDSLPLANLLILLDAVLGNIASKPMSDVQQKKVEFSGPLQEVDLAVEGMTCASCALLLEMVLKRDPRVKQASVNFGTESLSVQGQLSRDEICARVENLGYKAYAMDSLSQRKKLIEKEQSRVDSAGGGFFGRRFSVPR